MRAAWLVAGAVLLAAVALPPVASAAEWHADSLNGVDGAGCGPAAAPCKSVKVAMTRVAAGDTLFLVAPQQTPFPIEAVVFIAQSNVAVVGVGVATHSGQYSLPVLACNTTTALYVTALGSAIANLTVANCSHSGIIYDFESPSHGHTIDSVTFAGNRVGVGAEGCTLTIADSDFEAQVAGDITMGGGNLTLLNTRFNGVAPGAVPAGPLGSSVMCAKCAAVAITGCAFGGKQLLAPSPAAQLPVVWIGNSGSVAVKDCVFGGNFGAAVELQNVQSATLATTNVAQHLNATNAYGFVLQSVSALQLIQNVISACGDGTDSGSGPGAAVWLSGTPAAAINGLYVQSHTANPNAPDGALIVAHNAVVSVSDFVLAEYNTAPAALAVSSSAGGTAATAVSFAGLQWPQEPALNAVPLAVMCVSGGPNTVTTDTASTPLTSAVVKCEGTCQLALTGSSAGNTCASH